MLAILSTVVGLGSQNVSSNVAVEAWQAAGYECDELFFAHLDALIEYRFLQYNVTGETLLEFNELVKGSNEIDRLISLTHEGTEFLHCFGRR